MYSDEEVWEVLKKVNMVGAVRAMEHGLNEPVAENGDNLSQGEKQLLCIARSLLRRAKILVLDEATSACDPVTDDIIQQVLKSECTLNGTTVLTIAHRLHTIIDFDKILVMSAGVVAEYDSPGALLADSASEFSKMLEDYNSSHR
jgi:ATP-binding cassette subfamily C (CFTR/MRP) protein 1